MRRERALRLRLSAIVLAAFVAAALILLLVVNWGQGSHTASAAPGDGTAEFHMDVTGVSGCSTGDLAGPNDVKGTCTIPPGGTFTVNGYIDALGTGATSYSAFAVTLNYAGGLVSKDNPDTASWPDCVFAASAGQGSGLFINAACSKGIGQPNSEYTGKVFTNDFNCPQQATQGTITMFHDTAATKVLGNNGTHTDGGPDVLNINCGTGGGPTATPGGPTPTSTLTPAISPTPPLGSPTLTPTPTLAISPTPPLGGPTLTPTPVLGTPTPAVTPTPTITPTPTRRPRPHILLGDVDGDGTVGARDALWVLWFDAGIVIDVPIPEAADVNGDDVVDVVDALYILWADAGQLKLL